MCNSTTAFKLRERTNIQGEGADKASGGQRCTLEFGIRSNLYLSLTKVNEVLQINVIPIVGDGVVDDFSHFIPSLDRK